MITTDHEIRHYSRTEIKSLKQPNRLQRVDRKPVGLWISIEDGCGWKDYCESNEWNIEHLVISYKITLKPNANILVLQTAEDIVELTKGFGKVKDHHFTTSDDYINWEDLEKIYQGIIIAPYQWSCRLEIMWYYGWDCSSGCIWDTSSIQSIEVTPG